MDMFTSYGHRHDRDQNKYTDFFMTVVLVYFTGRSTLCVRIMTFNMFFCGYALLVKKYVLFLLND